MSKPEDFNLESLVSAAKQLGPSERSQFLLLLPLETRIAVTRTLEGLSTDTVGPPVEDYRVGSAATLIVEQPESDGEKLPQSNSPATIDEHLEIRNVDKVSSKTVVEYTDADSPQSESSVDRDRRSRDDPFAAGIKERSQHSSGVHLVKLHARGAIGEVFVAHDEKLSREVAIKRIRPELPPSERRVKRFLREAVITAKLQHPGIVPIYTMGDSSGSPHYMMPLVSGATMADVIHQTHEKLKNTNSQPQWISAMRPLLRNFVAACNAIDYAHTENVVHRDLKPSNILVGGRGRTMVVDWGCAKGLDETDDKGDFPFADDDNPQNGGDCVEQSNRDLKRGKTLDDVTLSGSVMGTVEFMSPEQASGNNDSVGTPSDIFGLGATLFSLLTNSQAIELDSSDEVRVALEKVKRGEFRRIEEIDERVPRSIIAVCRRAMAFKPEDRYATAGDLGRDVEAFLAGDIVQAYEEPFHDRMMRFIRRHKTLVTTLVGMLLAGFVSMLVINLVVNSQKASLADLNRQLTDSVNNERELRGRAMRSEDLITKQLYGNQMLLASEASTEAGGLGRMRELVSNWDNPDFDLLRGWEWLHLKNLGSRELWTVDGGVTANRIVTTRETRFAQVFDRGSHKILTVDLRNEKVACRENLSSDCSAVDFNRDQSQIGEGHNDGRVTVRSLVNELPDGSKVTPATVEHHEHTCKVTDVRWNIGGDLLATCDEKGNVVIWHVGDQEIVARGEGALNVAGKDALAWSFDGHQLYWTTGQKLKRIDVKTLEQEDIVTDGWITNPCNSHEGELLAYIGPENTIVVANSAGSTLHRFEGHELFVETLHWHPSKHLLLSCSADGTVRIWDADTKKEIRQLLGHEGHVLSASWNGDGTRVISGGLPEDALRLWDVSDIGVEAFDRELQDRPAADWHRSGESLVVAEGIDLVIQNSEGESRWLRAQGASPQSIFGVDFHPTQEIVACVSNHGKVWTVDANTAAVKTVFDSGGENKFYPTVTSRGVQWSPDGSYLAGVGSDGSLKVWNCADQKLVSGSAKAGRVLSVAWSPISAEGQQRVAAVGTEKDLIIFDPATEKTVLRIVQYGWKTGLAWSPDGKQLAVSDKRSVNLWNTDDGSLIDTCDGPSTVIWDVDWSSSQNRFAALTEGGKICIWDDRARTYLAKFAVHARAPYCIRWSPDGRRLMSTTRFGRIVFQDID